jgi:hypothetical protein
MLCHVLREVDAVLQTLHRLCRTVSFFKQGNVRDAIQAIVGNIVVRVRAADQMEKA